MGSLNGWLGPLLLMELSMGSLNGWRAHFYRWNYRWARWLAGPTFINGIIDGLAEWLAGPLLSMIIEAMGLA